MCPVVSPPHARPLSSTPYHTCLVIKFFSLFLSLTPVHGTPAAPRSLRAPTTLSPVTVHTMPATYSKMATGQAPAPASAEYERDAGVLSAAEQVNRVELIHCYNALLAPSYVSRDKIFLCFSFPFSSQSAPQVEPCGA